MLQEKYYVLKLKFWNVKKSSVNNKSILQFLYWNNETLNGWMFIKNVDPVVFTFTLSIVFTLTSTNRFTLTLTFTYRLYVDSRAAVTSSRSSWVASFWSRCHVMTSSCVRGRSRYVTSTTRWSCPTCPSPSVLPATRSSITKCFSTGKFRTKIIKGGRVTRLRAWAEF